jgi:SAM-dependent methyltransferase
MSDSSSKAADLRTIYAQRFDTMRGYRTDVWRIITRDFFQRHVPRDARVLDLGCGYGEFINHIEAGQKFGMDLNPATRAHLAPSVTLIEQDCSAPWPLPDASLDVVFTSNFFEHLPDKATLQRTLTEIRRCLAPGGRLIALGPNIRYLSGEYWDFWDHYLPLTERSLSEGLQNLGFAITEKHPRFLPYRMAGTRPVPMTFVSLYVRLPFLWRFFGKQFLVIACKP